MLQLKIEELCQCFYRKQWAKTRTMKSGLIQQQPGLIQAERQHASSWSHQGRFILQNWKCIFRTEPGKCRFRRRSSIPWQDHYGICRAPSNTGVSWGDLMLNLPEDQAHCCRCNKPSTAGMGRPHPQPAPRCSGWLQALVGLLQSSGQVSKGTRAFCSPQESYSNLPVYASALLPAPCTAPLLLWG